MTGYFTLEKINGFQKQRVPAATASPNNVVFIEGVTALLALRRTRASQLRDAARQHSVVSLYRLALYNSLVIIYTALFSTK